MDWIVQNTAVRDCRIIVIVYERISQRINRVRYHG